MPFTAKHIRGRADYTDKKDRRSALEKLADRVPVNLATSDTAENIARALTDAHRAMKKDRTFAYRGRLVELVELEIDADFGY
jgi:PII-like signaling protein